MKVCSRGGSRSRAAVGRGGSSPPRVATTAHRSRSTAASTSTSRSAASSRPKRLRPVAAVLAGADLCSPATTRTRIRHLHLRVPRHGRVLMGSRGLMGVTFTLDVEDHRVGARRRTPPRRRDPCRARVPRRAQMRGHVLRGRRRRGRATPDAGARGRGRAATRSRVHSFRHHPLHRGRPPRSSAAGVRDTTPCSRTSPRRRWSGSGHRCSRWCRRRRWAVDVLGDLGFSYSSSVLPTRHPLFGDPGAPAVPFRWPNGLVELPCPVVRAARPRHRLPRRGLAAEPAVGGDADRPGRAPATGRCSGATPTPTTSTPARPTVQLPEAGRLGSRIIWRAVASARSPASTACSHGRAAPPLAERGRRAVARADLAP